MGGFNCHLLLFWRFWRHAACDENKILGQEQRTSPGEEWKKFCVLLCLQMSRGRGVYGLGRKKLRLGLAQLRISLRLGVREAELEVKIKAWGGDSFCSHGWHS